MLLQRWRPEKKGGGEQGRHSWGGTVGPWMGAAFHTGSTGQRRNEGSQRQRRPGGDSALDRSWALPEQNAQRAS